MLAGQGAVVQAMGLRLLSRADSAHIGWDTAVALRISTCGAHSSGEAALECLLDSIRRFALLSFGKRRGQLCPQGHWEGGRSARI